MSFSKIQDIARGVVNIYPFETRVASLKSWRTAFQRRHSRLKWINIDHAPGHVLNFRKRHSGWAPSLYALGKLCYQGHDF